MIAGTEKLTITHLYTVDKFKKLNTVYSIKSTNKEKRFSYSKSVFPTETALLTLLCPCQTFKFCHHNKNLLGRPVRMTLKTIN